MPQFRPYEPQEEPDQIGAGLDTLFNQYMQIQQQKRLDKSSELQDLASRAQLAGQGIDPSGYDPNNPGAFFEPILQEAKAKKGREIETSRLSGLEKESNILKNIKETGRGDTDLENKLRAQLQGLSKPFFDVRDAYSRVEASAKNPSAAGDLALIFNYMKILDPGSTVREGEFATAQNSGSIPQRIQAQYNRAISGERLPDALRSDFVSRASDLYQAQLANQSRQEQEYKGLAGRLGVKPENVVLNLSNPAQSKKTQQKNKFSDLSDDEIRRQLNAP